jgi:hypothetical protein
MTDHAERPLLGRYDAVPRRRWRWMLPLLVGAGVVVVIIAIAARARSQDPSPKRAVASYLDAVRHGKTKEAYAELCDGFRRAVSYTTFAQRSAAERVAGGGVIDTHIARIEARPSGEQVATYIVRREAADTVFDAAIVREHGEWRLCGFRPRDTGGTTTTR